MAIISHETVQDLIGSYGYWTVAAMVGAESMGIPLPGETALVLAAIYAANEPDLTISGVIAAAAAGAIVGDNVGYFLGSRFAYGFLLRYGRYVGLTETRIKVGQYLFSIHGTKLVFFGRFVALLRVLAAFLAGVNRMPWHKFLLANAAGGILWATVFGLGGYFFGRLLFQLHAAFAAVLVLLGIVVVLAVAVLLRRYEHRLAEAAERTLPGPLQ